DSVVPNMVGVDIGCGMETVKLKNKRIDLPKLDKFIRQNIPSGYEVRKLPHRKSAQINTLELRCIENLRNTKRTEQSFGTLGGGNHFIEVGKSEDEDLYLVIHSGSRNVGLQVANYYQEVAYKAAGGKAQKEVSYELASLCGADMEDYLHDMAIMQRFAALNRQIMKEVILEGLGIVDDGSFTTIHNYIDMDNMILRKGAVSAKKGEPLLIPINMRDGSLICTGLGNEDWNCSAPHGAGRLMSRTEAKKTFTLSDFKKEMDGVYTTSVNSETLDECPMAYKPMEEIMAKITGTATVEGIIRPIYNFKASERSLRKRRK
ncbi:MAG TPA: RtcB family protein, partial [Oscillospiraceae bacterium]|nr:RtcB family protein [Oscillospiraceae bacterium]